jgi:hypothetical protein
MQNNAVVMQPTAPQSVNPSQQQQTVVLNPAGQPAVIQPTMGTQNPMTPTYSNPMNNQQPPYQPAPQYQPAPAPPYQPQAPLAMPPAGYTPPTAPQVQSASQAPQVQPGNIVTPIDKEIFG